MSTTIMSEPAAEVSILAPPGDTNNVARSPRPSAYESLHSPRQKADVATKHAGDFSFVSLDPTPWSNSSTPRSLSRLESATSRSRESSQAGHYQSQSQPNSQQRQRASNYTPPGTSLLAATVVGTGVPELARTGSNLSGISASELALMANRVPTPGTPAQEPKADEFSLPAGHADHVDAHAFMSYSSQHQHQHGPALLRPHQVELGASDSLSGGPSSPASAGPSRRATKAIHGSLEGPLYAATSHQQSAPASDWRRKYSSAAAQDPIELMLQRYNSSKSLTTHITARRERHMEQLQQFEHTRASLQAAQDAALSMGTGGSMATRGQVPRLEDVRDRNKGPSGSRPSTAPHGPAPPVSRFLSSDIMRDGAYLASGEYSFAATRPLRSDRTSGGLLFERYGVEDEDVPPVQHYYFRPHNKVQQAKVKVVQHQRRSMSSPRQPQSPQQQPGSPHSPQQQAQEQQQQQQQQSQQPAGAMPAHMRMLPNGIPVSRLERLREVQDQSLRKARGQSGRGGQSGSPRSPGEGSGPGRIGGSGVPLPPDLLGPLVSTSSGQAQRSGANTSDALVGLDALTAAGKVHQGGIAVFGLGQGQGAGQALQATTAEPLLDDAFYSMIQGHFKHMAENQTVKLQQKLNGMLPGLMESFGCSSDLKQRVGGSRRSSARR